MNLDSFFANKRTLLLIVGLLSILILLFLIRLFTVPVQNTPGSSVIIEPNPSITMFSAAPFPSVSYATTSANTKPLVYTPGQLKQDYDRITKRSPLSTNDKLIQEKLLAKVANQSGIITETDQFQVEYIKSPDLFMVEIKIDDAERGKKEAELYFLNSGISSKGICNLPIVFYLSPKVQNSLVSKGENFNPIPTGC